MLRRLLRAPTISANCWRNHGSMLRALVQRLDASSRARAPRRSPTSADRSARPAACAAPPRRPRSSSSALAVNSRPARLPSSSERMPFRNASLNVRPIAIASPTDFICVVSVRIGLGELLEVPSRDLDDDVVDGRLEGRGREARDVVRDLVEVIAERQLRGDLRDRKAGGLRRQRRRPRHARVHLDDDHPPVRGVHGELDVAAAGFDADAADDPPRGVAHPLVFLVASASAPARR